MAALTLTLVLIAFVGTILMLANRMRKIESLAAENSRLYERYRTLFEGVPVGLYRTTLDARVLDVNAELLRILGYPNRESVVKAGSLYVDPNARERWGTLLERDTTVADFEAQMRRRDGSVIWVQERARAVRDAGGRIAHFEGVMVDITARKRAQARAEANNAIVAAAAAATDLTEFLGTLIDKMLAAFEGERGGAWLDEGFRVSRNEPPEFGLRMVQAKQAAGVRLGRVAAVEDWERLTGRAAAALGPLMRDAGVRASIAGPLLVDGRPIGGFAVCTAAPRRWLPEETAFADAIGRQVGAVAERLRLADEVRVRAEENARLYETASRRTARLQALREIDRVVSGSLDLRVSLNVVLTKALAELGADAACVLMLNPLSRALEYAADQGFRTMVLRRIRIGLGDGLAGRAALERRRLAVEDLDAAPDAIVMNRLPEGPSEGFKSTYAVPLIAKGRLLGVLQVFHRTLTTSDDEWLEFLDTLAGQTTIAIDDARQFEALQRSNTELALAYETTLAGWARALELRDRETGGHTQRVAAITVRLAAWLGVPDVNLAHIRRGALLHDIGKMAVSDAILLKPGKLTPDERMAMEHHPAHAHDLLMPIPYLRPAIDIPHSHHEKWDGTGYPRGLRGDEIPLAARIFAVVDVWDALTSERPYRSAWSEARARAHLLAQAGKHFDPRIVEAFLAMGAHDGHGSRNGTGGRRLRPLAAAPLPGRFDRAASV